MTVPTLRINKPLNPRIANNTSIKLIGLGGVGSIVARYLSIFLVSLGQPFRLVLIDGDSFKPSNRNRMFILKYGNKADVIRNELLAKLADSSLSLIAVQEYVGPKNINHLIHSGDIVLLAVDNHATRKLVSDFCMEFSDICLISGGNDGVDLDSPNRKIRGTYGNCQIYIRQAGQDLSPSLTQYHPEIQEPQDSNPGEENCTDLLQSVPQILFANLATASAVLNTFWIYCCDALHYSEISFDIADGLMRPVMPFSTLRINQ